MMKILSTLFDRLFDRKNLPILAVLLGLLGFLNIQFDLFKVGQSVIQDKPAGEPSAGEPSAGEPSAGEPFSCTLATSTAIRNRQGEVHTYGSGNFASGECGDGFISKKKNDRVTFPVDGKFRYLKAGTIELCLTPEDDFFTKSKKDGGEVADLWLVRTESNLNAIILQLVDPDEVDLVAYPELGDLKYPSRLRLRIKSFADGQVKPSRGRVRSELKLEWERGEHYHIACTWGEKGLPLYVDGKDVGREDGKECKLAPKDLRGRFVVNSEFPDVEDENRPTHCIISNLVIHGAQLDPEDLGAKCPIRESWHPKK